jgi:hypothetical protein
LLKFLRVRSLLCVLLVGVMLLSGSTSVFAAEIVSQSPDIYYDYVNDFYFTQPMRVINGVVREISYDEYMETVLETKDLEEEQAQFTAEMNRLNGIKKNIISGENDGIFQPMGLTYSYNYSKGGEYITLVYSKAQRVSPIVPATQVETTVSVTVSTSVSESFSGQFGASKDVTDSIKMTLTLGYSNTSLNSQTFGISGKIPLGRSGYVQFTPRMLCTYGTVTQTEYTNYVPCHSYSSSYVSYLPTNVGGYADGDYVIVLQ